jgi:hypothetical protein
VDSGTAASVEGSCEYIERSVAGSQQGFCSLGFGRGANKRHGKNCPSYETVTIVSGIKQILWNDLSNEKGKCSLARGKGELVNIRVSYSSSERVSNV